nr:G-type lectin S-receptor-like serine/threonine-protein kinase At4g27290 [Ipomoea batatas]
MMNSGFLDFAVNIPKLEHFEGVGFRRWQKKMKFLLAALNVAYVLSTPKPVEQEDETLEATLMEQFHEIVRILGQIRHHGMNMDDSIAITSIIDKFPPSWNKFKKNGKGKGKAWVKCWVCYGPHFKKDCEVWKEKMRGISSGDHGQGSGQWKQGKIINLVSDSTENFIAMISEVYVMQTDDSWWVDTGATRHVCKDMNLYKSYKNLEDGTSLYMGNDSMVKLRKNNPRTTVKLKFDSDITVNADTITTDQPITDGGTIVSAGGNFELGFFSPGSSKKRYIGIWYSNIPTKDVVWVANRETPLNNTSGKLMLKDNGILVLLDGSNEEMWSSNSSTYLKNPVARLLDTGNLVVLEGNGHSSNDSAWQSFDYPGNTLLPGMKLGRNLTTGHIWSTT